MINYTEIQNDFNKIISHSQGIEEPQTDDLFKAWALNKSKFIEKWGGMTYESDEEIQFELPDDDKRVLFEDFAADCSFFAEDKSVKDFLLAQGKDSFYENRVSMPWVSKSEDKIQTGMKISKALKFFFGEEKYYLNQFQVKHSRLIQDCKVKGKLVMSVHPIDFLSIAENAHQWHSCHALDSVHRAGNLSYMMDKHTFVVYLKSNQLYKLPNFPDDLPWNSKKWRVIMYLREDEKYLMSGRQYPFSNEGALDAFKELFGKVYDTSDWIQEWERVPLNAIEDIMEDSLGSLQFNDCLDSPTYRPVAIYSPKELLNGKIMEIGDAVVCVSCGLNMISLASSFCCDDCGGYSYCDECGQPEYEDNMYLLNGRLLCEDCFNELGNWCDCCGELSEEDLIYDEDLGEWLCPICWENVNNENEDENA